MGTIYLGCFISVLFRFIFKFVTRSKTADYDLDLGLNLFRCPYLSFGHMSLDNGVWIGSRVLAFVEPIKQGS